MSLLKNEIYKNMLKIQKEVSPRETWDAICENPCFSISVLPQCYTWITVAHIRNKEITRPKIACAGER